jgi:hypothetical protein
MSNHETLTEKPSERTNKFLLALDFDGVLNRFNDDLGPERRSVRTGHGQSFMIDFDPEIIAEVDDMVREFDMQIGWLTTWGPNMKAVIEQAFDGLLAGGFVLKKMPPKYRGKTPFGWKYTGLRDHLEVTGQPWAWADDEDIDLAQAHGFMTDADSVGPRGLLVRTRPVSGITVDEIELVRAAARGHAEPL